MSTPIEKEGKSAQTTARVTSTFVNLQHLSHSCPGELEGKGHSQPQMAVGQNQWYHFGVGAPPILVYFSGDWDVH